MSEVGLTDNVVEMMPKKNDVCQFCEEETVVPAWRKQVVHHLVVTIDEDRHCHVHGPVKNFEAMKLLADGIRMEMKKLRDEVGNYDI